MDIKGRCADVAGILFSYKVAKESVGRRPRLSQTRPPQAIFEIEKWEENFKTRRKYVIKTAPTAGYHQILD